MLLKRGPPLFRSDWSGSTKPETRCTQPRAQQRRRDVVCFVGRQLGLCAQDCRGRAGPDQVAVRDRKGVRARQPTPRSRALSSPNSTPTLTADRVHLDLLPVSSHADRRCGATMLALCPRVRWVQGSTPRWRSHWTDALSLSARMTKMGMRCRRRQPTWGCSELGRLEVCELPLWTQIDYY